MNRTDHPDTITYSDEEWTFTLDRHARLIQDSEDGGFTDAVIKVIYAEAKAGLAAVDDPDAYLAHLNEGGTWCILTRTVQSSNRGVA